MKLVKGKTMLGVLILLLIATGFLLSKVYASPPTLMSPESISVPTETRYVDETFNVSITVENITNLFLWQIKLFYDPAILNCTDAPLPPNHVFAGHSYVPVDPIINDAEGWVLTGSTLIGTDFVDVPGVGTLVNVEFKALVNGTSTLNFSTPYGGDTYLWDGDLTEIPVDVVDGSVEVIVPEFSVPALSLLFILATVVIVIVAKKALPKRINAITPYIK